VILRFLQRVFAPLAIAFLAWFAWKSRAELVELVSNASPFCLSLAVLLWCLTHLLAPIAAMLIFNARGASFDYRTAARIHYDNLPARYVPGGIWHTVGRVAAFRGLGLDAKILSTFVVMENAVAVATAFMIGGSTIYAIRGSDAWGQIGALCALAGGTLLLALPFLLRGKFLTEDVEFPVRTYLLVVALVGVYWILAAAAFVAYVSAYSSLALQSSILETGAAYLLSWGIGFLAVFAPQGIGIFEVVASDLLRGGGSFTGIAALLAGFRLAILIADALVWACGRLLLGQSSNGDSH
jgi:hypothetical protein